MPYPIPPAPRIAYDDPGVASVFLDRSVIAKGTGNPNVWVDANLPGVVAMNAGEGFAVGVTHDHNPTAFTPVFAPYEAVWQSTTDGATFEVVFQELYTIRGLEMIVAEASNDVDLVGPIKLFSIDEDQDPFGIVVRAHGNIPNPDYNFVLTYPTRPAPSFPVSLMTQFPTVDTGPYGPTYASLRINSPQTIMNLDIRRTKALRFTWTPSRDSYSGGSAPTEQLIRLNLYGYPSDRNYLNFISATQTTVLPAEDLTFGDSALGSSKDLVFRIKNFSETKTANSIVLKAENGIGYDNPQPYTQILFSTDGINFSSTLALPYNLPPGATSFLIYVRKVTPGNAAQGQKHPRIRADVGSWT